MKAFRSGLMDSSDFKYGHIDIRPDFRDFGSDFKVFRPDPRDCSSYFKDFRDFTPDLE